MKVNYLKIDDVSITDGDLLFWVRNLFDDDSIIVTNQTYSDGSSFSRSKLNERKFVLNGFIRENLEENITRISQLLNGPYLNVLTVGTGGTERFIYFKKENIKYKEPWMNELTIACVAPNPRFYSTELVQLLLGDVSTSPLHYPITYPITYGVADGAGGIITNVGNYYGYPVFTVVGSCSGITLSNATTGESMTLDVSLSDDDILIVDGNTREITLNGVKRMDLKNGQWIRCVPGDNEIGFVRSTLQEKQHCTVALRSVWV